MKKFFRSLGAAVLGYIALAVVSFVLPVGMWMLLGPDGSFQGDSWDTSGMWNAGWIVVALLGAAAAGFVCTKVAADRTGLWILIGAMVVFGVWAAVSYSPAGDGIRPADVGMLEAMGSARSPTWLNWLNVPLAVAGAVFGARVADRG